MTASPGTPPMTSIIPSDCRRFIFYLPLGVVTPSPERGGGLELVAYCLVYRYADSQANYTEQKHNHLDTPPIARTNE